MAKDVSADALPLVVVRPPCADPHGSIGDLCVDSQSGGKEKRSGSATDVTPLGERVFQEAEKSSTQAGNGLTTSRSSTAQNL